jgi:hypothetical protein
MRISRRSTWPSAPRVFSGYEVITADGALPAVAADGSFPVTHWEALCTAGKKLVGGGCSTNHGGWFLYIKAPKADFTSWACYASNLSNAMSGNQRKRRGDRNGDRVLRDDPVASTDCRAPR